MRAPAARWSHAALVLLLLIGCAPAPVSTRVVGWNIETVGAPGTTQYNAALDVLERLDAPIVALNEINGAQDALHLDALAEEAGYGFVVTAPGAPFGALRTAIISRWPFISTRVAGAADLSGDPAANDVTRLVVTAVVDVPDAMPLTVLTIHAKSGSGDDDAFRRAIESTRAAQALAGLDPDLDPYVVLGDFNQDPEDIDPEPLTFFDAPRDLPNDFRVGRDIERTLNRGLSGDAFDPLVAPNGPRMTVVDAPQTGSDDRFGTRPASGRRLDYALVSPILTLDAEAEAFSGDRPGTRDAVTAGRLAVAADHLPIVLDVLVPPICTFDRDCPADGGPAICVEGQCVAQR